MRRCETARLRSRRSHHGHRSWDLLLTVYASVKIDACLMDVISPVPHTDWPHSSSSDSPNLSLCPCPPFL